MEPIHSVHMQTVGDNESQYTKNEVERAKLARSIMLEMGCSSAATLIKLTRGLMSNLPISAEDVYRATKIYGPMLGAVKGKTRIKKAGQVIVEHIPRPVESNVTLHCDLMFISEIPFLISVAMPLGIVMCNFMTSKGQVPMRDALNGQLKQLKSRFFTAVRILVDGEGAVFALRDNLAAAGVVLEGVSRNQHVPAVEVRIKIIKNIFRSIITSLPYKLPKFLYKYLVFFGVSRVNMYPVSSRVDPTPARELFTGRKLNYAKDVRIGFGEYCQIDAFPFPRNDATKSRTRGALSLDPRGNLQGSVRFYLLGDTKTARVTVVTRDTWVKMVVTNDVIDHINYTAARAEEVAESEPDNVEGIEAFEPEVVANEQAEPDLGEDMKKVPLVSYKDAAMELKQVAREHRLEEPPTRFTSDVHVPVDDVEDVLEELPVEVVVRDVRRGRLEGREAQREEALRRDEQRRAERRRARLAPPVVSEFVETVPPQPPPDESSSAFISALVEVYANISYKKGLMKYGDRAMDAAEKELRQMLEQDVWSPVLYGDLPADQKKKVIRSFMFLKEKFTPEGLFDKLKMRLVAGGHMQEKQELEITSSPTVSLTAVHIIFTYAAAHDMIVVTVDITGAYLNASMKHLDILMRIDPELVDVLIKINPTYAGFRGRDGSMIVKLKKALYGCVESAKLWYDLLAGRIIAYGLKRCTIDECVFRLEDAEGNVLMIVALYVDDLIITSKDQSLIDEFNVFLRKEFKTITENVGDKQNYLGMTFNIDRVKKQVEVTMEKYVEDVIDMSSHLSGCAKTPATSNLFDVDDSSPVASDLESQKFHSVVAKVLYLAKRARPDLLTTISFLSSRVKDVRLEDIEKLNRMLRYIRGTKTLGLVLIADPNGKLVAYVDASFGVHILDDGKSQTGVFVTMGSGPIFVKSAKQRLVTKGSTEAELVAVSDALPQLLWIREFMLELKLIPPDLPITLMEDNQSTIALIKRGRPVAEATRHIKIRHFFISDKCKLGEVVVIYVRTEDQIADFFTKGLVGITFFRLRSLIVCFIPSSTGR